MQAVYQDILNHAASLLALSPSRPEFARQLSKKLNLTIPILCDKDNAIANKFGLVFTLPDQLREVYLSFGIDLERYNGNSSWSLPMPACFIIGQSGIILDAEANADYTSRPEPEQTLARLIKLTEQ